MTHHWLLRMLPSSLYFGHLELQFPSWPWHWRSKCQETDGSHPMDISPNEFPWELQSNITMFWNVVQLMNFVSINVIKKSIKANIMNWLSKSRMKKRKPQKRPPPTSKEKTAASAASCLSSPKASLHFTLFTLWNGFMLKSKTKQENAGWSTN